AWLRADVVCYSFIVTDFHHLLLAGLPAHCHSAPSRNRPRDGSVSGSKKSCTATMGAAALLGAAPENMTPSLSGDCPCRSGKFCIGSRGGHYCLSDSGKKSYLKK
ncbi:hypothetical protein CN094_36325, partial [Sinorhizobium meliloti]